MAADSGESSAALRHPGRRVVWTARAKVGRAVKLDDVGAELEFLSFEKGQALSNAWRGVEARNALGDHSRDLARCQLTVRRQDPVTVLVKFPDHARPHVFAPIIELLFELVLDDCALFFHDEYLFEPLGKMPNALAFKRPRHRHLVESHADLGGMRIIDPKVVKCLAHVEIRFARRDDAKSWPWAVDNDPVEPVRAGEGEGVRHFAE